MRINISAALIGLALMSSLSSSPAASDPDRSWALDWSWTYKSDYFAHLPQYSRIEIAVTRAWIAEDRTHFDVMVQNTADKYACLSVNATDKTIALTDETGREYVGAEVELIGSSNNKIAPGQRKRMIISAPALAENAQLVSVHFGIISKGIDSDGKCEAMRSTERYAQHMRDWEVRN